jgi:hypothetical protein
VVGTLGMEKVIPLRWTGLFHRSATSMEPFSGLAGLKIPSTRRRWKRNGL